MSEAKARLDQMERRRKQRVVAGVVAAAGLLALLLFLIRRASDDPPVALLHGTVMTHVSASKRLSGYHSCEVRLDDGRVVKASCNDLAVPGREVRIQSLETWMGGHRYEVVIP